MANEVRVSASLSYNKYGLQVNGTSSLSYTVTGENAVGEIQIINSGLSAPVTFQNLADVKYLFLKNQSATGFCSLSTNSGQSQVFAKLYPDDFAVFPPVSTGIWASGAGATLYLQKVACES